MCRARCEPARRRPRPRARRAGPSARVTGRPVDVGVVGTSAGSTTRTITGAVPLGVLGRSMTATSAGKISPIALTICAARCGEVSVTETSSSTESSALVAVTCFARSSALSGQAQAPRYLATHPLARQQLRVGGDALLGKLRALIGGLRACRRPAPRRTSAASRCTARGAAGTPPSHRRARAPQRAGRRATARAAPAGTRAASRPHSRRRAGTATAWRRGPDGPVHLARRRLGAVVGASYWA